MIVYVFLNSTQHVFRSLSPSLSSDATRRIALENASMEQQLIEAWKTLQKINPVQCARSDCAQHHFVNSPGTYSAYMDIISAWPYINTSSVLVEERGQSGRRLIMALHPDQISIIDGVSFTLSYSILYANLKFFGANEGLLSMCI